ncbi:MAG TPA: hypothetical protein VOA80_01370 [Thermoanaerobaculia bacterium]|nr:hypothetical protein [Thermoanaerobaculia bacterium]
MNLSKRAVEAAAVRRCAIRRRTAAGTAAGLAAAFLVAGCALIARRATVAYMAVDSAFAGGVKIDLDRSFVERYKDRVTIQASFTVDQSLKEPFPAFLDGDLHFAGRSPQVGFPTVGEILDAANHKAAVDLVHQAEALHQPLKLTGVWRVWPEHAGGTKEQQGHALPPLDTSNPSHVFEIHPVTRVGRLSLLDSLRPIKGFKPGDARAELELYEKAPCALTVNPKTVSMVIKTGLYNDVEFLMEATGEPPLEVSDGRFMTAAVRDLKGDQVLARRRMVLVKGSAPELAARRLKAGERLHVWGIPRVDFAEISRRAAAAATHPAALQLSLPYEIIVVGLFEDKNPAAPRSSENRVPWPGTGAMRAGSSARREPAKKCTLN